MQMYIWQAKAEYTLNVCHVASALLLAGGKLVQEASVRNFLRVTDYHCYMLCVAEGAAP
jgi:hypothetical protein